ncbi:UNVERIFIED_CONTAM: hypothetical protein FKN15_029157 [Acipenser sinensis]
MVHHHQHSMKQQFDKVHRVKSPAKGVLDWVRAKGPHRNDKLQSFWSSLCRVSQKHGLATFQPQDGSRWLASRLRKEPSPKSQPVPFRHHGTAFWTSNSGAVAGRGGPKPVVPTDRPLRVQQCPGHLQDFVTSFHT